MNMISSEIPKVCCRCWSSLKCIVRFHIFKELLVMWKYVLKIKTSFFSYTQDQFATLTSCRPREINEKMKKHENNRFFILIIYYTQGNYASLNFCKTESRLNTCVDPLIAESILGQPAPLLYESGRMAPIELPSSPVNELFCTAVHYTTPHGTTLHYTILRSALPLIRVQIRKTEQNKRGKKDMITAPSGNKDCGIRMFGILVWIWKLFSHPLFKRPYSLTFCWAWFVTKLNKIQKKNAVWVITYNTSLAQLILRYWKIKESIKYCALLWDGVIRQYIIMSCSDCCKIIGSSYPVIFEHYSKNHRCDFDRPNTFILE